ncbi:MAG: tyrosine-protein kinase [Gaiellaceae bacterium]|nr:tyrosine-protein kinase [Gaiellaceae bacterium]
MDSQTSLEFLWRQKWIVLATLILTMTVTILLTLRMPKTYEAGAFIQVDSVNSASTDPGSVLGVQQASQGLASSYATLISSPGFLAHIRPNVAGGRLSLGDLQSRVSTSVVSVNNVSTNLIKLTATGPLPASARDLARDVADAFVTSLRYSAVQAVNRQKAAIDAQIAELNKRIAFLRSRGTAGADELSTQLATRNDLNLQKALVIANGISRGENVRLASEPTASAVAISPRPVFNAAVGFLLGLLAGIGLAWLRERLDVGLHGADEAEKVLEVPNLATIPLIKGSTGGFHEPLTSEAYDVLRTNLVFLGVDQPLQVLTFTSFNPGEGKSSVVRGLARAAQRSGSTVLILDCDLRAGSLTQRLLGQASLPGLTNLIVSDVGLAGKGANGAVQTRVAKAIVPLDKGLSLLPAGPLPPNPTGLLSSKALVDLMQGFRREYDLILVDSPPVANLADASLLASLSDGVVLVARVGLTKRKDLSVAASSLRHSPTPIVGAVVFERRPPGTGYYPSPARERVRTPRSAQVS